MVILETVESLYFNYKTFLDISVFFSNIFSIEYIGRLWSCIENKGKKKLIQGQE